MHFVSGRLGGGGKVVGWGEEVEIFMWATSEGEITAVSLISREMTHVSASFNIYRICTPLHCSTLNIIYQISFEETLNGRRNFLRRFAN